MFVNFSPPGLEGLCYISKELSSLHVIVISPSVSLMEDEVSQLTSSVASLFSEQYKHEIAEKGMENACLKIIRIMDSKR